MDNQNYTSREYREAGEKVNKCISFYIHLAVYLSVNIFFHVVNWIQGGYYWAIFPALGWGIGLFIQGINFLGFNSNWKQKQIKKELEKMRKNNSMVD